MEYISIKNNSTDTTNIHLNVFSNIVNLIPSKIKGVKINNSPKIIIVRNNQNVDISFEYTISKKADLFETTNLIKKTITDIVVNLINFKPHNILMNYMGRH